MFPLKSHTSKTIFEVTKMYISITICGKLWGFAFLSQLRTAMLSSEYFPKHFSKSSTGNTYKGYPRGEMKVRGWLQRGHGKSRWLLRTSSLLSQSQSLTEQQPELQARSAVVGFARWFSSKENATHANSDLFTATTAAEDWAGDKVPWQRPAASQFPALLLRARPLSGDSTAGAVPPSSRDVLPRSLYQPETVAVCFSVWSVCTGVCGF